MQKLSVSDLYRDTAPEALKFRTTRQLKPLDTVIGQKRAVHALQFGLEMDAPGFNIFVGGLPGTGKSTIIQGILKDYAQRRPTPPDRAVVFNFENPHQPRVLTFPAGEARRFAKRMQRLVSRLRHELKEIFSGEQFLARRREIIRNYEQQKEDLMTGLQREAEAQNIKVLLTEKGFQTVPMEAGEPLTEEQFAHMPEPIRNKIKAKLEDFRDRLVDALRTVARLEQDQQEALEELQSDVARAAVSHRVDSLADQYRDNPEVLEYLESAKEDFISHVEDFLETKKGSDEENEGPPPPSDPFTRYQVNLLVDNSHQQGAPVVYDPNPTYYNLFGRIEKQARYGMLVTDFTHIQAGSLLKANGGYLLLEIDTLLRQPLVWEALKQALRNGWIQIEDLDQQLGFSSISALKCGPIPLDVKVILLGRSEYFHFLQETDDVFNKTFKVRADFDYEVKRKPENEHLFARFVARVCRENKLPSFRADAVAEIVNYAARLAEDQQKLSLRFGLFVNLIHEAAYWARQNKHRLVRREDVQRALAERRFRLSLFEEKVWEQIQKETLLIDVTGEKVGQINGLAVYSLGEYHFGKPARVTATTYMGRKGIISVERQAGLSGPTYDKGNYIIRGFLGQTFAQKHPLTVDITLTFEQNYGGIDGDSASSTELYAILSALSGYPIKQSLAVTGSVNQWGQIQAIGGVNEKIEGFFRVCKCRGLTGDQGVLIPSANRRHLMLSDEVLQAVEEGKFHIWTVDTIYEGIELLTGKPAGKPNRSGRFPRGTVFGEAQRTLDKYFEQAREWGESFNK